MKIKCKGLLIDNTADTFGRTINAQGVNLERFTVNPVMLGWHDSRKIPIGQATMLKLTGQNTMELEFFLETDLMPADMVAAVRSGILRCLSSGLNILQGGYLYNPAGDTELLSKTELSEASVCSIGRNKNCTFVVVSDEGAAEGGDK